jgi:hypothetical protein
VDFKHLIPLRKNSEDANTLKYVLSIFCAIHRIGVIRVLAADLQSGHNQYLVNVDNFIAYNCFVNDEIYNRYSAIVKFRYSIISSVCAGV